MASSLACAVAAPTTCAWCQADLSRTGTALKGRVRCTRCGVATTSPWPTDAELDAAYAGWYRPDGGRFSGPGRSRAAALTRAAGPPDRRIAPPGAGTRRRRRRRHAARCAARPAAASRSASSGALAPDVSSRELEELDGPWAAVVLWHSLEHLRAPGEALRARGAAARRAACWSWRVPNADSLQARAFGDRWLALDLPRHLVHIPARALLARSREVGLRVERDEPRARRPGACSGGCTARGLAAGGGRPLRRHPPPAGAQRRCDRGRRARHARRRLRCSCRSPPPRRWSRPPCGAAAASTWRPPWLSPHARGEGDRGDAGAERGADPGADSRGDPARVGGRDHPGRRQVHRQDASRWPARCRSR